ncbi:MULTISPECIES: hypothetical protein [unclassified Roseobacter]|uniref:hypothetical protein n=1 Tax=unclassified Roseobacter TaxID=196798 RepID=UPI0030EF605C
MPDPNRKGSSATPIAHVLSVPVSVDATNPVTPKPMLRSGKIGSVVLLALRGL